MKLKLTFSSLHKEINQEIEKVIAEEKNGAAKMVDGSQTVDDNKPSDNKVDGGGGGGDGADTTTETISEKKEKTNGDISSPKPTINGTVKMTPEAAESKSDTEDNEKSDCDEKSKPNIKP